MAEKIGIYVCECGPNIKDAMDIDGIIDHVRGLEGVVFVKPFKTLCSQEGQALIKQDIKKHSLSRVVIAACSPKEHELTFRKTLKDAGLNPYFLQIANIREQCAWVIRDRARATEKAKTMTRAAVKRVIHHAALEPGAVECKGDALVVGAGVAGISAALTLAQRDRKVYLIERSPCIGGKVARYEEVFPNLECAPCMLDPKLDEVLHNEHIKVLTLCEVQEVVGSFGNFVVKVKRKARHVDMMTCIGCGACTEACPVTVPNEFNECMDERKAIYLPYPGALPFVALLDEEHCVRFQGKACDACQKACPFGSINYDETDLMRKFHVGAIVLATGFDLFDPKGAPEFGYGNGEDVYTSLEFERMLSSTGPTGGNILMKNGKQPRKIAFVNCVGSRSERFNDYCSGVCCSYSLKFAHITKQKLPDASIVHLYSDFCLPGKESHPFFAKLRKGNGIAFLQVKEPDSISIAKKGEMISIHYGGVQGKSEEVSADMVVLATALQGARGTEDLARICDISRGDGGFFCEEHNRLAPVSTMSEGIYIAGCAQGPKDIQGAVAEGQAAAGRILSRLVPGEKLTLEAMTCVVNDAVCSGCKTCIGLCPYKALIFDLKKNQVVVNEVLCRGCGVCVAGCPSGAITAKHFTDEQIVAEIKGLLEDAHKGTDS